MIKRAKDIYDINHSSLKDAVMHFGGGCTAELISGEGLVLTNHHCGYGTIQKLSTVDHDYLENGYWAMNRDQELPSKGLTVTFLDRFEEVTVEVTNALTGKTDPRAREEALRIISDQLTAKAVGENKYLKARVASYFGDNQLERGSKKLGICCSSQTQTTLRCQRLRAICHERWSDAGCVPYQ